ncbi:hypothetical protein QG516_03975 [Pedobacter gandavensis]|uniref:hypothetical protein n=1 Tax=Pedobacter gandavensis TaxID=2679963 RepID=UPI0024788F9C|nr:hypothetical protein [Pedobacter gandavensis]WGQ10811.1 hypothetical protein QG516_03975 [Pedobacter gandavensis]
MKTKTSKAVKHLKKVSRKKEISFTSVNLTNTQIVNTTMEGNLEDAFIQDLSNEIRSGNHELWRMWC